MNKTGLIFLLFSLLIMEACIMALVEYPGEYPKADEFHKTVLFEPGGTFSLTNFDGNIEITGWEKEEVEVYAEKFVDRPMQSRIRFLWKDRSVPKVNFENYDDFIKVSTRAPSKEGALVDYFIHVPRSIHLEDIIARSGRIFISDLYGSAFAELADGDIEVENFSGSLTASVTHGSITAALYDMKNGDEVILKCREGNVTVFLQEGIHAFLRAEAPNGQIADEFQLERKNENFIDTQIGEGGAEIRITALNGNIRINRIQ